jgi:hypothetical protein
MTAVGLADVASAIPVVSPESRLAGEVKRAAAEIAEARRLSGDRRYASIANFAESQAWSPATLALAEETFFAGLRLAGVPTT